MDGGGRDIKIEAGHTCSYLSPSICTNASRSHLYHLGYRTSWSHQYYDIRIIQSMLYNVKIITEYF